MAIDKSRGIFRRSTGSPSEGERRKGTEVDYYRHPRGGQEEKGRSRWKERVHQWSTRERPKPLRKGALAWSQGKEDKGRGGKEGVRIYVTDAFQQGTCCAEGTQGEAEPSSS